MSNQVSIEYDRDGLKAKARKLLAEIVEKAGLQKEYTIELENGFYATMFYGEVSIWIYGTKEVVPGIFEQINIVNFNY